MDLISLFCWLARLALYFPLAVTISGIYVNQMCRNILIYNYKQRKYASNHRIISAYTSIFTQIFTVLLHGPLLQSKFDIHQPWRAAFE